MYQVYDDWPKRPCWIVIDPLSSHRPAPVTVWTTETVTGDVAVAVFPHGIVT